MHDGQIQDVADTAFLVAGYRAIESARKDALFHDPLAARLSEGRGKAMAAGMRTGSMVGWSVVIRTVLIDGLIRDAIQAGIDTIVNLGAGLDSRPYRMDLPSTLTWIEVDQAAVIDWKEARLHDQTPRCVLERLRVDLADDGQRRSFLQDLAHRGGRVLVLTEGVVPYLTEAQTGALADDLLRVPSVEAWIVDYFSPQILKYRKQRGHDFAHAPFRFDPADWQGFFAQHGWKPRVTQYIADVALRVGRPMPLPWFIRVVLKATGWLAPKERREAMRKSTAYVVLERASG